MKFYEAYLPYYALLKARDKDEAIQLYKEVVSDELEEIEEVERDYALVKFSRAKAEDGKEIPISKVLNDFQSNEPMVLLIDSALL